jgi:NADH dehydrogenase
VLLGEVVDIDPEARRVVLADGSVDYDTLVLAAGARHHYFGHPEWESIAPGLKTIEDATEMRRRILFAFEAAEREPEAAARDAWLTFVIVGATHRRGAGRGALAEIGCGRCARLSRIDPGILLEAALASCWPFPADCRLVAAPGAARVAVRTRTRWPPTQPRSSAEGRNARHAPCCGRPASRRPPHGAGRAWRGSTGRARDRRTRLHLPVIRDLRDRRPAHWAPPGAPLRRGAGRHQQGHVARLQRRRGPRPAVRHRDRGSMATIGRGAAVADRSAPSPAIPPGSSGFSCTCCIVEFDNRLAVLLQWAWKSPGIEHPITAKHSSRSYDQSRMSVEHGDVPMTLFGAASPALRQRRGTS